MTAPWHLPALDRDPVVRADALDLLSRVVALHEAEGTDLAGDQWHEPAEKYSDPGLWARETAAVHRSVPLPLSLSCELPAPGAYKAMTVAGVPVLLTRTAAGSVQAALNSCRHRGAALLPEGTGATKRLVCPYHSWCYELTGELAQVEDAATFGELDRSEMGLITLPVEERAGLVFACLTPGRRLDLDSWLGSDLLHLLETLGLADCHHHSTRRLDGPNWKLVLDGYLEGYHIATAHRDSVLNTHVSNRATFDSWGPHLRNGFALRTPVDPSELPPDPVGARTAVSPVYWLFPGASISGGWGEQVAVSLVYPGSSWDSSRTEQHILLRSAPVDEAGRTAADASADRLRQIVLDEDYGIADGIQHGLDAVAGRTFVFGRNEPALQHFHGWIDRLTSPSG